MLLLLGVLVEHAAGPEGATEVEVFPGESEASTKQKDLISTTHPKEVKLCEYSSHSVCDYLVQIANGGSARSVKLLVCHPDSVVHEHQRDRILQSLHQLSISISKQAAQDVGFKVGCYKGPATLRGRNFGDKFIVVGWYTYDYRPDLSFPEQIWGAQNPLVIAMCDHPYGGMLKEMFDTVFADLWKNAIPLQQALSAYPTHGIGPEWLESVSEVEQPVV